MEGSLFHYLIGFTSLLFEEKMMGNSCFTFITRLPPAGLPHLCWTIWYFGGTGRRLVTTLLGLIL